MRLINEHQLSERRACGLVGLSRDSYRHPPVASTETAAIKAKIVEIAHARRRFGYRRVHDLLRLDYPSAPVQLVSVRWQMPVFGRSVEQILSAYLESQEASL